MFDITPFDLIAVGEVVAPKEIRDPQKTPDWLFQYIDIGSVSNGTFQIVNSKQYLGGAAPSRARKVIRENDVLFATTRPYLRSIAKVPAQYSGNICSTGFCVLRPTQKILPDWLLYCAISNDFIRQITQKMRGANYPAVTDADVLASKVPLPPISEQRRIVARIKECMARVEEIERTRIESHDEVESLVPAALEDVFHLSSAKEVPLHDILEDKPKNGVYLPKEAYVEAGGIPIIRMGEMFRRFEVSENVAKSVFDNGKLRRQYGLNIGDVLVARRSIVYEGSGSMAVVTACNKDAIFESSIIRLRIDQKLMLPDFLVAFFHSREGLRRRLSITKKATISGINQKGLFSLKVPLPSMHDQREAIGRVNIIRQAHKAILEEIPIKETSALRESILRKAFAGEL